MSSSRPLLVRQRTAPQREERETNVALQNIGKPGGWGRTIVKGQ